MFLLPRIFRLHFLGCHWQLATEFNVFPLSCENVENAERAKQTVNGGRDEGKCVWKIDNFKLF